MERGDQTTNNCGYWLYSGSDEAPSAPRIFTRAEKGQALTHLEMDFNLASLHHKLETSSISSSYDPSEEGEDVDTYFERHKPTREEEMAGLFATFSYAPIKVGDEVVIQNPDQMIKIQHTTDEIRYKLSNEQIPGTLDIEEDFRVTGSIFTAENLSVSGNAEIANDVQTRTLRVVESASVSQSLRVGGTGSFDGDVYIKGNLYVNGVMFGNLSNPGYNSLENPNYAQQYTRFGTQDTGSQSDVRLKSDLVPIYYPLEKIEYLTGYEFDWKPEAEKQGHDVGLIAQDLQAVYPQAVSEGKDGYLRIDYEKVVPLLVQAVKELSWQVRELNKRLL